MIRLTADRFAEPSDALSLREQPLVVHQRVEPTVNDKLVIFVHGLGGGRYGTKSTWGNFPRFIFEDIPELDVGMYQYRTLKSRLHFTQSVSLQAEANVFADIIRDQLANYTNIVLIGHSMGGLLCKAVIHRLVESGARNALTRIGGLILMATPQLGSMRIPGFLSMFSYDARALKPHGEFVTKINRSFEDHIELDEKADTLRKETIPTWAVEGISDLWVDPLSSGIGLASSRRKVVRGSHTAIVKPSNKDADAYMWVKERVEIALHRFKYDVFIAAAMAGTADDAEYQEHRDAVLALIEVLKNNCNCPSVFYAGTSLPVKDAWDPKILALQIDLQAMRESKNFILFFPKKIPSSVLYEAGWALILGKPSIYITPNDKELPFLLNDAGQAFPDQRVRIFKCADREKMLKEVASYGDKLFHYRERLDL
ncbi:MAG: alpha/beta hydrolase [Sulfuriferula multivorans]|uniref:Alpha/beta hydrolase n=1 Tax=Sulfuriferula multivorans TaxID=1559896 RepID=A0A7C9KYI4_9PROT|nr:alpha/beta hydrolase [Sulfuriferula multivorans]